MSPLGLLALLFTTAAVGGSAVVWVYDKLEARLAGERAHGEGGAARSVLRPRRAAVGAPRLPRGVVVTVRAGARPAGRGEVPTVREVAASRGAAPSGLRR